MGGQPWIACMEPGLACVVQNLNNKAFEASFGLFAGARQAASELTARGRPLTACWSATPVIDR